MHTFLFSGDPQMSTIAIHEKRFVLAGLRKNFWPKGATIGPLTPDRAHNCLKLVLGLRVGLQVLTTICYRQGLLWLRKRSLLSWHGLCGRIMWLEDGLVWQMTFSSTA